MAKSNQKITLPSKHRDFVDEYLTNGYNATEAYASCCAGKSTKSRESCGTLGSNLLQNVKVKQYLELRIEQRKKELHVDQNYVVRKLLEIVECDVVEQTQYLTKDELDKMPKNVRKLVTSIETIKTTTKRSFKYGNETEEEFNEKYKVTFMSKDKAIDSLGKHTGAFMKDNITLQGNIETKSFTDALKDIDI